MFDVLRAIAACTQREAALRLLQRLHVALPEPDETIRVSEDITWSRTSDEGDVEDGERYLHQWCLPKGSGRFCFVSDFAEG
jgi:hypothetical protein